MLLFLARGVNAHSAELLPDGNIAVALSGGGDVVKVHCTLAGSDLAVSYPLPLGHGVVWDKKRQVLWAMGKDEIRSYEYNMKKNDPALKLKRSFKIPGHCGHELFPSAGKDSLFFTEETGKTLDIGKVATFTDGRAMFASGLVDAVVATLPTHEHARYAVWALQAGLHVFSEKPMARTSGECATMMAAAKRARRVLMIGQCIRFWPGWDTVKEYMRSGKLGKFESLRLDRHGAVPGWLKHDNWFIDEKRSGGCVLDLHLHDADYVNFLLGMPRAVQAVGVYDPKRGGWSEIDAHYIYPGGVSVGLRGSWDHHTPFFMKMRAGFKKGVLDHGKDGAMLYSVGGKPRKLNVSPHGGHYLEMVYFLDRARKNKPPAICPPDACAQSVRLIEATVKAMETGTTVKL